MGSNRRRINPSPTTTVIVCLGMVLTTFVGIGLVPSLGRLGHVPAGIWLTIVLSALGGSAITTLVHRRLGRPTT